jgi:hypothetical protein
VTLLVAAAGVPDGVNAAFGALNAPKAAFAPPGSTGSVGRTIVSTRARHAPDVPVVEAVGRHDDRMIVPEPAEPPAAARTAEPVAAAHREGAP